MQQFTENNRLYTVVSADAPRGGYIAAKAVDEAGNTMLCVFTATWELVRANYQPLDMTRRPRQQNERITSME